MWSSEEGKIRPEIILIMVLQIGRIPYIAQWDWNLQPTGDPQSVRLDRDNVLIHCTVVQDSTHHFSFPFRHSLAYKRNIDMYVSRTQQKSSMPRLGWFVLKIYVALTIFQANRDLETKDTQSLKS